MPVLFPVPGFFESAKQYKLELVPFLLTESGDYPVEGNRYLAERSLGEWKARLRGSESSSSQPTVLTVTSRKHTAQRLLAFLSWSGKQTKHWRDLEYSDVLEKYQVGLLNGTASTSREPLAIRTVNLYVNEACLFLVWAGERGYRPPFVVHLTPVKRVVSTGAHSTSHEAKLIDARMGAIKPSDQRIELPTNSEIRKWRAEVISRHPVKWLMFECMLRSGMRISEVNLLRLSCFPKKDAGPDGNQWKPEWLAAGHVPVTLRFGVKGPKLLAGSDFSLKTRDVFIPLDLAERICEYIAFVRPTLLRRHALSVRKAGAHPTRTDRLWLGEKKCQPTTNSNLGKTWRSASCPKKWNPHMARHYFAVETIAAHARDLIAMHNLKKTPSAGWLFGLLAGQIRILLTPLLGHCDEATSMIYLKAARPRFALEFGDPMVDWSERVDSYSEATIH